MARANVRVRPAISADLAPLVALLHSTSAGTGSGNAARSGNGARSARGARDPQDQLRDRLAGVLADDDRTMLVACDESGEVLGALATRVDRVGALDLSPVLHVTHLVVGQRHRRRGIGRALLAASVQLADQDGLEHIVASVTATSREGNRYLARVGFAPLQVQRITSTAALRRSLGLSEASGRVAVLRRTRLVRAQRAGLTARGA